VLTSRCINATILDLARNVGQQTDLLPLINEIGKRQTIATSPELTAMRQTLRNCVADRLATRASVDLPHDEYLYISQARIPSVRFNRLHVVCVRCGGVESGW